MKVKRSKLVNIGIIFLMICVVFTTVPMNTSASAADDLVSKWKFEDNYQDSVDGNHGAGYGVTFVDGIFDRAASFDGVDDYVDVGYGLGPVIGGSGKSFSLEAWTNRASSGTYDMIITHGTYSAPLTGRNLHFGWQGNDQFTFAFYADDLDTPSSYTDTDGWHHWVGTYDGGTNARTLYRDGIVVGSDTAANDYLGTSGRMLIGRMYWGQWYHPFDGELDEVAIYNRALSSDEVSLNYQSKNDPPIADAGGPYTGDEGTELTFDASGSSDPDSDPLEYRWDFDNDGTWDTGLSSDPEAAYEYSDDYNGLVVVEVFDGTSYSTATADVTISNVPPEATIPGGIGVVGDNYVHVTTLTGSSYFIEINDDGTLGSPQVIGSTNYGSSYGAGIGDFDNDGDYDALIASSGRAYYYEKLGDGNDFAVKKNVASYSSSYSLDFAEADFNNDGNLDAVYSNWYSTLVLMLGNGDGTFTTSTLGSAYAIWGMDAGDYNEDGNMDFIAGSNYGWGDGYIHLGNGDGSFQAPTRLYIGGTSGLCTGDFDGDGHEDLIYGASYLKFYRGNGDGTFTYIRSIGNFARGSAAADIDGDGNLDLLTTTGNRPYYLQHWKGNGDGTFTLVTSMYIGYLDYGVATVKNPTPFVWEGEDVDFAGTYEDPGWDDTHTATWSWGDGSAVEAGTITPRIVNPQAAGDVTGSHTFVENGVYTITLMITDDDGGSGTTVYDLKVANAVPVVDAGDDLTADEGSPLSFSGSFSDAGILDTHTFEWDFGDGTTTSGTLTPTHTYGDSGSFTVTLYVTDDDGGTGSDTLTVTVANLPPIANAGEDIVVNEGEYASFSGSATDPGWLDTFSYSWDFGDGSSASGSSTPTHRYYDDGDHTVTLTVTDDDGGVDTDTMIVHVDNVAPSIEYIYGPTEPITVGETGWVYAYFNDPGIWDTFTAVIDWGDGTQSPGYLYSYPWEYWQEVYGSHIYTTAGTYTATLTVTDDDGGVSSRTIPITVLTPAEATEALIADVQALNLEEGIENSFVSKLDNAIKSLINDRPSAGGQIGAFINEVEAQDGKALTHGQAYTLIQYAQRILASMAL